MSDSRGDGVQMAGKAVTKALPPQAQAGLKAIKWVKDPNNRSKVIGLIAALIALAMFVALWMQTMLVAILSDQPPGERTGGTDPGTICVMPATNPGDSDDDGDDEGEESGGRSAGIEALRIGDTTYSAERMRNALTVVTEVSRHSDDERVQIITLITVMQESMFDNIGDGDGDRDSVGLFQQRPSQGWGTVEEIMDIPASTRAFLGVADHTNNPGLFDIDWEPMSNNDAAQAVQRSGHPNEYGKHEEHAQQIYDYVTQFELAEHCAPPAISDGILSWPINNPNLTSKYGMRMHPVFGYLRMHAGQDFGHGCGTPVYAAADGQIVRAEFDPGWGNYVKILHGNYSGASLETVYAHFSATHVSQGQMVSTGEMIGLIGTTGTSTGCHLHLEVHVGGQHTDPADWLP